MPLQTQLLAQTLDAPILVVDDDPVSLMFIGKTLKNYGFNNVITLDKSIKALAWLDRFKPELIILDICMSGLNGLECCERIRAQHCKTLPILMLTALRDEKLRFKSFRAGATDFVTKPLHPEELYARVSVHLQNQISSKWLKHYHQRLDLELSSARELQVAILPCKKEIKQLRDKTNLNIASHLSTSSEIGGDFWGIKQLFPDQTALWTVDFSGHGVAAALNAFRLQAYLKDCVSSASRPGEYLSHLNDKLLHILPRGYFATMFYGVLDTRGNTLYYATACAPHPFIKRKNGQIEKLDGSGVPLGICMQFYPMQSISFHPGDTLMLYSDALTEAPNAEGKRLSDDDIMQWLEELQDMTAEDLKEALLERFHRHALPPVGDDLTLCICKWES